MRSDQGSYEVVKRKDIEIHNYVYYHRAPFEGQKFCKTPLAVLFTIHVNLQAMKFPLIFKETNFVKVPKQICEIYGSQKSALRYYLMQKTFSAKDVAK